MPSKMAAPNAWNRYIAFLDLQSAALTVRRQLYRQGHHFGAIIPIYCSSHSQYLNAALQLG